jgi:hypothetical protein
MQKRLRLERPSHTTVVAYLTLFLVISGGAAYAAGLAKNSVGSKQLKSNAVTAAKIKNEAVSAAKVKKGTLTGTQIDASTLGTVPSAASAESLGGLAASGYQQRIRWAYISGTGAVLASGGGPAPTVIPEPPGVYYIEWGSPVTGDAVISSLAESNVFSTSVATSPCGGLPLGVACFKGSNSSSETLTVTTSKPEIEANRSFYIELIP